MKIINLRQMDKKHFQDDSPPTYRVDEVRLKYQNAIPFEYGNSVFGFDILFFLGSERHSLLQPLQGFKHPLV